MTSFAQRINRPYEPTGSLGDHFDENDYSGRIAKCTAAYLENHPDYIAFAVASDPALEGLSADSVRIQLESYPGVRAMAAHERAHQWYEEGKALLAQGRSQDGEAKLNQARWLAEAVHAKTGIDIHPGTQIGENFFVDHATGDVIGETATIGNNTRMYHGVTLGALGKTPGEGPRHPQVGNDCVLSMGVKLLGCVRVGNNVKIGPGSQLRGNNLTLGDHVTVRDNVLIEDGYRIEAGEQGLTFGNGVTLLRNPLAGKANPVLITREKLAAALGLPPDFKEVPAQTFIQLAEDGQSLICSMAGNKWSRQIGASANDPARDTAL
jgi:serine acetyltransferase